MVQRVSTAASFDLRVDVSISSNCSQLPPYHHNLPLELPLQPNTIDIVLRAYGSRWSLDLLALPNSHRPLLLQRHSWL